MKYINGLIFCTFFILLVFNNVFGQEKSAEEKSNKEKNVVQAESTDSKQKWGFVFVYSCCRGEYKNNPPIIADLILDKTELRVSDSLEESERILSINVFTDASDPDGDVLVYKYDVSGGKIIGQSRKVIWDLTGVEVGTYTIKVSADDGCGICGNTITKTVIIK